MYKFWFGAEETNRFSLIIFMICNLGLGLLFGFLLWFRDPPKNCTFERGMQDYCQRYPNDDGTPLTIHCR